MPAVSQPQAPAPQVIVVPAPATAAASSAAVPAATAPAAVPAVTQAVGARLPAGALGDRMLALLQAIERGDWREARSLSQVFAAAFGEALRRRLPAPRMIWPAAPQVVPQAALPLPAQQASGQHQYPQTQPAGGGDSASSFDRVLSNAEAAQQEARREAERERSRN